MYSQNGSFGRIAMDLYSALPYMVAAVVFIVLLFFAYKPSREFLTDNVKNVVDSSYSSSNSIGAKTAQTLSSGDW